MKVKEEIEYLERADLIYRKILLHDRYKQTIFIKADVSRGTFKSGIIEYMDKIGI